MTALRSPDHVCRGLWEGGAQRAELSARNQIRVGVVGGLHQLRKDVDMWRI